MLMSIAAVLGWGGSWITSVALGSLAGNGSGPAAREGDRALATQAAGGDGHARRLLVRRLLPRVRRIARALIGNPHDADDAAQSALLAILEAAERYRGDASLETWAKRITVRVVLRHAQRERKHRGDSELSVEAMVSDESVAEGAWETLPRSLRSYLDELPAAQREALLLRHALEHSIDEIAELTGVRRDTVRGRLRLGAQALRKMVRRELVIGARREESP